MYIPEEKLEIIYLNGFILFTIILNVLVLSHFSSLNALYFGNKNDIFKREIYPAGNSYTDCSTNTLYLV